MADTGLSFDGVIMEWMLKGVRRASRSGERRIQWTPLLRGWRNSAFGSDVAPPKRRSAAPRSDQDAEYAWRWEWEDVDPVSHEVTKRRRGKGWVGFAVYHELYFDVALATELGVTTPEELAQEQDRAERELGPQGLEWERMFNRTRLWLHMLDRQLVHPYTDVLSAQVVSDTFLRSEEEIERWRRQTVLQEARIAEGSQKWHEAKASVAFPVEPLLQSIEDTYFPPNRRACANMYGDICEFYKVCWNGLDPSRIASGFVPRTPHHDQETEALEVNNDQ
jgi:hypothetical protein